MNTEGTEKWICLVIIFALDIVFAFIVQINLQIFSILTNFYLTHGVGPRNINDKQASINYFLVNEGGSQIFG